MGFLKWCGLLCIMSVLAACMLLGKPKVGAESANVTVIKDRAHTYYTGLKIPAGFQALETRSALEELKKKKLSLPAEYDLRLKYTLSPIEDQGQCGSCWAFSIASTFQDALVIAGTPRNLSEQYLVSCNTYGFSCNGGFFEAHNLHKSPKGGVNQADMPYTATNGTCKQGLTYREKLTSWAYLPGGDNPSSDEIKAAIYQHGTISVGVSAGDNWGSYRGGKFTGCQSGNPQLNHAVNLVGWSDSGGYWIMRNSWGTSWGDRGYMLIPYGCDGIGAQANYIVYDGQGPTPDPTPGPTPDPGPTPPPGPTPDPACTPQPRAETGTGPSITVRAGITMTLGSRALPETTYYWTAEPAFDSGAKPTESRVRYRPRITKTLTVHAVTKCGEATKSVIVNAQQPTPILEWIEGLKH
jgi:hypothetical protein